MNLFQFAVGIVMIIIGAAIILNPELATIIAAVLIILGALATYGAVHGTES